jgi:hypothetical protein
MKRETNIKPAKHPMLLWLERLYMQIFLMVILLISILLYDCWVVANTPDSEDIILNSITLAIILIFFLELSLRVILDPNYRKNFYIILDMSVVASMIMDLTWVQSMTNKNSGNYSMAVTRIIKLLARYSRIWKLLVLVRFTRLNVFQNITQIAVTDSEADVHLGSVRGSNDHSDVNNSDAVMKASLSLSKSITLRLAVIVTFLAIIIPILSNAPQDVSISAWLSTIEYFAISSESDSSQLINIAESVNSFYSDKNTRLVQVYVTGPFLSNPFEVTYRNPNFVKRRENILTFSSKYTYLTNASNFPTTYEVRLQLDGTRIEQLNAAFSLAVMGFVGILLLAFNWTFHLALERHMEIPLNKLINSLRSSAKVMMRNVRAMSIHFAQEDLRDDEDDEDIGEDTEEDHYYVESVAGRSHTRSRPGSLLLDPDDISSLGEDAHDAQDLQKMVEKCKYIQIIISFL